MILKVAPLPEDIRRLGVEGVNLIWRDAKLRGAGMKRAKTLVTAAEHSVGSKCYPAFYLVLNHPTFNQIKKKHGINYSDKFYIRLLYAVFFVLSYSLPHKKIAGLTLEKSGLLLLTHR